MTLNINPVNWFEISAVCEKDVARARASRGSYAVIVRLCP